MRETEDQNNLKKKGKRFMRTVLAALLILLPVPASWARECDLPQIFDQRTTHVVVECMLEEIEDLKKRQAELEAFS